MNARSWSAWAALWFAGCASQAPAGSNAVGGAGTTRSADSVAPAAGTAAGRAAPLSPPLVGAAGQATGKTGSAAGAHATAGSLSAAGAQPGAAGLSGTGVAAGRGSAAAGVPAQAGATGAAANGGITAGAANGGTAASGVANGGAAASGATNGGAAAGVANGSAAAGAANGGAAAGATARAGSSGTTGGDFSPVYRVPLRVHVQASKLTEAELGPVFDELNRIWLEQAGICFEIEVTDSEDNRSDGFDFRYTAGRIPGASSANGLTQNAHSIWSIDHPQLNDAPHPVTNPTARTTAHELGHALGLAHENPPPSSDCSSPCYCVQRGDDCDDYLLRSGTKGFFISPTEVEIARKNADRVGLSDRAPLTCGMPKFNQ